MRYIRLNPRFDRNETLEILKAEICKPDFPILVPWLSSENHGLEFFAIPSDFCLNRSTSFRSGRVYGMDVTSGAAVAALLSDAYDVDREEASPRSREKSTHKDRRSMTVLDLCCAPGLKLCTIADIAPPSSVVVGVDISQHRISLCKNIIKKYHIDQTSAAKIPTESKPSCKLTYGNEDTDSTTAKNESNATITSEGTVEKSAPVTIRLYCADGTTFGSDVTATELQSTPNHGLVFDSNVALEEMKSRGKRKRLNKSARAREKRRLLELHRQDEEGFVKTGDETIECKDTKQSSSTTNREKDSSEVNFNAPFVTSFDRILVDAECSTDGAVRHIEKRSSAAAPTRSGPAWDDSNMDELVDLQKRLIDSGFNLLQNGGILVYSTCSLSSLQNEDVVQWLLNKHADAFVIPVSFKYNESPERLQFMGEGTIRGTVRFKPSNNNSCELLPDDSQNNRIFSGGGFFLAKIGKK